MIRFPELPAGHERPAGDRVAEIARDMMKVEEARGEAVRSRAAGLLGSCGVLRWWASTGSPEQPPPAL